MTLVFINPYYVATVRDYIPVQMHTGEQVELWSEGDRITSVDNPGDRWPELISAQSGIAVEDLYLLATQDSFSEE